MDQDVLNLVCLLDLDAYSHAVDARLDQDALAFISRDRKRVEDDFG